MRKKTSKVTSMFFILAILTLMITMLLTSLINIRVFRPKPEEIARGISQMTIDSDSLSFSGYRILKDQKSFTKLVSAINNFVEEYESNEVIPSLCFIISLPIVFIDISVAFSFNMYL